MGCGPLREALSHAPVLCAQPLCLLLFFPPMLGCVLPEPWRWGCRWRCRSPACTDGLTLAASPGRCCCHPRRWWWCKGPALWFTRTCTFGRRQVASGVGTGTKSAMTTTAPSASALCTKPVTEARPGGETLSRGATTVGAMTVGTAAADATAGSEIDTELRTLA
jgi:hypothetical protein